jgi:hypothetical protein
LAILNRIFPPNHFQYVEATAPPTVSGAPKERKLGDVSLDGLAEEIRAGLIESLHSHEVPRDPEHADAYDRLERFFAPVLPWPVPA